MTRLHGLAVVILALLVACGSEGTEPSTDLALTTEMNENLSEALDAVKSNVDALIERVAADARTEPRSDNSVQQSCNDAEGAPTGDFRSQFGYVVDIGSLQTTTLLEEVQDFFASQGMAVNASRVNEDPPALFAEGSGFSYSAIVNSVGHLVVGGTTPCFPPK